MAESSVQHDVSETRQLGVGLLTELNQDSNGSDTCVPKDIDHGDMIDRNSSSSVSSKDDSIEVKHFIEGVWCSRLREKLVFVISVTSMILMAYALVVVQWLLPYYYAISAPLLIGLRICLYIKLKWQYFLIDFCYFGNTALILYLWLAPYHSRVFMVMFGIANGPLAWAAYIFRNSLVFHDVDKMTSVYIHTLPMFLTYGIRWYSETLSRHWYTSFVSDFDAQLLYLFIWLVVAPFACFAVHTVLYLVFVYGIFRPDESYLNSYRYLISKDSWMSKTLNVCGSRHSLVMYFLFNWLYSVASLIFTMLLYQYFIIHSIYLVVISLIVVWNAAVFYVDVFSVRGFRTES